MVAFDVLAVGAGGGGGADAGSGGGGGAYYFNSVNLGSLVSPSFNITVGIGGRPQIHTSNSSIPSSYFTSNNFAGSATTFVNSTSTFSITAYGGGAGQWSGPDSAAGWTAGGSAPAVTNSLGLTLGTATSSVGGSGGAGIAFGSTCGNTSGAAGIAGTGGINGITSFPGSYAGGGGGGACLNGAYAAIDTSRRGGAGVNGGGNGSGGYVGTTAKFLSRVATANSGGGGGAGASHGDISLITDPETGIQGYSRNGAKGADGVVKVRYKNAPTSVSTITSPSNVFAATGTSPTFSVSSTDPGGGTVRIQWQVSTDSGSSWSNVGTLNTGTSNTYTVSSVTTTQNGYQYRALVRNYDAGGNYSETASNAATLRVTASTLSSISFSPSTVTTGTTTQYLVNGSASVQQSFFGCYSDRTDATRTPLVGSGTWIGSANFSRTNSGTTPETFVRELWFNRDSNGNPVNSVPSAADCTRIAGAFSPDISATLVTNPTASVTSSASAYTPAVGSNFSTTLTSSGIGSSVSYSVSPSLPAGLTLSPSTGVIQGTPTTVQGATSYTVTATGSTYGSATRSFTIEVVKGTQTVAFTSSAPSTPLPNGTYTPTATSSIGQTVTLSVSSSNGNVCSISGGVVTFQESGDCVITATQAGTSNYLSATATQTITVGRLSQTVTFSSVPAKTFGDADFSVSATTTAGSLPIVYASTDTAKCTVAGSTVRIVEAGNCVITATQTGTAVYLPASQSLTISVAKASQATVTVTSNSTVVYGSTLSLTASGGSGSASGYVFTKVSGPCTISGTTLSTSAAGDCVYNAYKAGDANYNQSATSANFTTTITPKPLTLSVTVSPSSRAYNTTRDVTLGTTTASNLTGIINGDDVSVDHTKLSATVATADVGTNKAVTVAVASGYLTGTKAGNYQLPTISGSPVLTITQATQSSITFSSALTTIFGQNITLAASGGSGTGALTFATSSGACQIASSILTPVSAGTCVVVATRAADTNYTAQTASYSVSIAYADQAVVSMTSATTVEYGTNLTLGAQGGSGTGAYEFAKVSGNCSVSGTTMTPSAVGDCVVKARKAGDSGYNVSAWSADVTISITPKPLTIVVTPFPSSRDYNGSRTVILATLSSAHVTGLVGNDSITLDNSKISATVPDASVGVNKPVTTVISSGFLGGTHAANYQEPTVSNSPVLTITQATQSAVTMSSATTFVYGSSLTLTATGGTGTGALEYAVVSGNCSVTGDSLTASSVGDCVVKARRAADTNYSISEWSASQTVTVTPKPLTLAVTVNPSSRAFDTTRTVTLADTTAADLTGIINNDVVNVDNSKLSATVASAIVGDNKAVTVTVALGYLTGADAGNYQLPTISGSPTINIVKADQTTVTMTSATTVVYGNTLTLSASGGESVMGYEYEVVSGPCSVSAATLSTTAAGTCVVRGRHLGDTNYNVSAWSANVNISVTPKPLTLSVTVDPSSRPYNTSTAVGLAATSSSNLTGIINNDVVTTDDTKLSAAVTTADVGTNKAVTVTVNAGFLTGTNAANYSVSSVSGTPVLTITQTSQASLSWTSALTTVYGSTLTLSASGGSGTGALSYATTSGPCTVSSSIVTPTSVGTCVVVVTRAADTNYTAQTLTGNVSITQAAQATVSVTSATTVVYGSTLTLTATGGSGTGAFDYAVVTGDCTLSGDVLTAGSVGDCEVKARRLASTNYLDSAWSSNVTVSVTAKPITLTVSPVNRQWNGETAVSLGTTTAASLTGIEAGDSVTVDHSKLSASVATAAVGDNKAVTVTVAAGYLGGTDAGNYQLPTIAGSPTVNITRANQSALSFTSATTMVYGQTLTLAAIGGSGTGAISYSVVSGSCTVSTASLSAANAGDCVIRATKAQDSTYLVETVDYTVSVGTATQSTVSVSNSNTVVYGQTLTLTISGGNGTGAAEFERISGPCSISGDTLSTTAVGDCVIHARKLTDGAYDTSAWSANFTITITPKPISLSVSVSPSSRAYDTTRNVALAATSASNLTGIINGDTVTTDDTKLTATVSSADVGTNKAVTVTVASGYLTGTHAANYSVSSVTGTPVLTITQANQGALSWVSALSTVYGQDITLSATGGSGTGALSYAKTSGPCTVSSSIVTPTSVGTCVVVVTRAADTNYTAQTLTGNVAIGQATQSTVSATSATTVVYGSTLTLTATGGNGSGAYEFQHISGDCDVTGSTLTPLAVGDCEFKVRKLSSTNYLTSAWSTNVTVSMTAKPLTLTVSPVSRQYDGTRVITLATSTVADLTGIEAGDQLTVDHSQLSATVANSAVGTNKAVTVTVGAAFLSGADVANYLLPTIAGSPVVDITRANQASLSFTSANSTTYGIDIPLSVSGGTGTGAVSYSVSSGPCAVSSTTLTPTASGTCVVTATKAQDSTYLAESVSYNVAVAAADQASVTVTNSNTVVYGSTLALTASGGTGSGAFEFAPVSGPCSVSGSTLSTSSVGTCVIQARKLGDSAYNASAWSANYSIAITAKPLTLSVTVSPASRAYDTTRNVSLAATSAANLSGIINNDVVSTDDTKLSATIATADVATNKAVTVTVANGYLIGTHAANYQLPTVSGSPVLTVTQASQTALSWTTVLTTIFGQNLTLSASGGSGTGALSYATTSGPCSVASSIVTPSSVGTCVVVVTRAADTNYTAQTLSGNVEISQASQATVTMTNATTVVYGSTLTLTATGGSGSGAFDFAKVNGNCVVENGVLTPLGVGDCVVHARKLSSTNYTTSAWSNDLTVTMTAKPLTLSVTAQNRQWNGGTSVSLASTSVADLTGVEAGDSITVDDSYLSASVATADVGTNKAVTVTVSAGYLSGVDAVNYQLPVIAGSPTVNISKADQATLSFTSATSFVYGQTLTLTTTGGTGTSTTSYAVDSGPCSVSGSTLSSSAAGSCVITATKAQDANYLAQTATSTVEIAFANQAAVSITSATTVVYGSTLKLTATGGTGTGAFEFAKVSGPCSISGTTLSTTAVGNCIFQARKQADSGYNASAWTSNYTVTITPKPLSLAVTVDPSSRQYNTSRTVTLAPTSASNLTGIINNDVVSTDDSKLSAQVSTADVATNKVVTVTVAQGFLTGANAGNYQLPTVSGTPVITITRTAQAAITVTSALTTVFGQNISLSATGGSGTGALTFATTGGPCMVALSIMTPTSAGSCVVVATRAEDTNYLAQTQTETISIAAATQSTVTITSATTVEYGSTLTLTASGGSGTGAYSFTEVSGACDVVGTTLIPLSAGECVIHARKAGDASYATSAWSADVTITLTPKPLTLFVTPSPGLRPYNGSSIVELATTTAADLVGIEPGDDVSVDHSKLVATVSSPSVGVNKAVTVTVNAGYVIGPDSGNYQLPTIVGTPLLTITQTNQAGISFANASSVQYGQNLNLVASGGSGSGALTIVRTSGPCTVTNNVMTSTGVGTCAVTATRAADATYLEESTTANITITRASQTLNFTSNVPEEALPGMTYTPVAVSSGGASVSLNITNGLATVCSMSNGVVTFLARGQCVITASQSGTTNYLPASSVSQTIVAGMLNQTITFPAISDRNFGSSAFSASATVNSGLSLGYNTTTGSICSVNSSGLITPLAVGTCSITVTQASGNDVYAPASPVTRTYRVLAIVPTAPQITSVSSGDSSITVAFTPPASRGGAPITNYVLTATPTSGPSIIKSDCAAVPVLTPPACTISGLINGESYTVAIAATNSAGTGPDSNTSPSIAPATAPDSVASLAAIPGNTTLTVTWRPPTNFGGGTFSRYEVTITPRGESPLPTVNLFASTANRHTFTGLTNGVAYDVEVVVISSANTTDMGSNRANAIGIPATEASAPRNVVITPTSSSTALVTWEVPTSNGGSPITGYSLSPGGCIFSTPTATRCEYRGLTPGSTLNVSVTAMNIMGGSPAAEASAVMPAAPVAVVSAARTVSPTVTPTPPVEAPPVISSIPEFRDAPYPGIQFDAPATGNAKALLDGNEIEAWLSVSEQKVTVQTEQGVLVTLENTTQSTTNGSSLVLNPGSTVAVEAQGYTPNSPLEAWIFSTPARLGSGIADETGAFKGEFPLSSASQLGQHTVVLHGLSTQGEVVTVAIGVKIVAPVSQTPEPESGSDSLLFSSVLMFLAVMVTLTVLVMRRRARKSGE
ncbi:hypothetical protein AINA4_04280 [Aurantimicrobium sp. INA4]|nr:hypothetical protein AINA4_04280 [Aurantimicrobium sp. INA4]